MTKTAGKSVNKAKRFAEKVFMGLSRLLYGFPVFQLMRPTAKPWISFARKPYEFNQEFRIIHQEFPYGPAV